MLKEEPHPCSYPLIPADSVLLEPPIELPYSDRPTNPDLDCHLSAPTNDREVVLKDACLGLYTIVVFC